jgi:hypothetical protein
MTLILALALQVSTHVTFGQSVSPPLQTQGEVAPPMVVPAVTEFYGNPGYQVCDMGACTFVEGDPHDPGITVSHRSRITCLDKRRVLVTTEAGTALCILFPEAQREFTWPDVSYKLTTNGTATISTDPPPSVKHCHMHGRKVRTCKLHKGESR